MQKKDEAGLVKAGLFSTSPSYPSPVWLEINEKITSTFISLEL
jgi:hypothetical protein